MDLRCFNESISVAKNVPGRLSESRLTVHGKTANGLLWVACLREGARGVSTIIASTKSGNNRVITFDTSPRYAKYDEYQETSIAAIARQYLGVVEAKPTADLIRRHLCSTAITVGLDVAVSQTTNARYLELTTRLYPNGTQEAFLGGIAIHPVMFE